MKQNWDWRENFLAIEGHVENIRRSVSAMDDSPRKPVPSLKEIDAIDALERR